MGINKVTNINQAKDASAAAKSVTKAETVNASKATPKASEVKSNKLSDTAKSYKDEKSSTISEKEVVSEKRLNSALDRANDQIRITNTKCEFSYHEDTKRISIKVIDKATDKVVREIPAEETLDMISKLWEIAGLIVDEKR